ncbi:hypothetical protein TL16_g03865 [Triparma laevis f. inornata]|uniref:DUF3598 domain-containing protein n=1 Tax=Triparma laevis f. inornata TaxID=1714386 RepID=A0A9W7A4M9_9STRA|nr:hypothetical protein TL16_g03865 [Triparma laevis f. inornata]
MFLAMLKLLALIVSISAAFTFNMFVFGRPFAANQSNGVYKEHQFNLLSSRGGFSEVTSNRGGEGSSEVTSTCGEDSRTILPSTWDLFKEGHIGSWHGEWLTTHHANGTSKAESVVTAILLTNATSAKHVNTYIDRGDQKLHGFYHADTAMRGFYLPNSFCWGPAVLPDPMSPTPGAWAIEIGLRHASVRVRLVLIYSPTDDNTYDLVKSIVIRESLDGRKTHDDAIDSSFRSPHHDLLHSPVAASPPDSDATYRGTTASHSTSSSTQYERMKRKTWKPEDSTLLTGNVLVSCPKINWGVGERRFIALEYQPDGGDKVICASVEILLEESPTLIDYIVDDMAELVVEPPAPAPASESSECGGGGRWRAERRQVDNGY